VTIQDWLVQCVQYLGRIDQHYGVHIMCRGAVSQKKLLATDNEVMRWLPFTWTQA